MSACLRLGRDCFRPGTAELVAVGVGDLGRKSSVWLSSVSSSDSAASIGSSVIDEIISRCGRPGPCGSMSTMRR
jgi:hypothetical protein